MDLVLSSRKKCQVVVNLTLSLSRSKVHRFPEPCEMIPAFIILDDDTTNHYQFGDYNQFKEHLAETVTGKVHHLKFS